MKIRSIISILLLNFLIIETVFAQGASVCGDPPPVANESLKADIEGKAQLLTRFLGEAQLSGKIEQSRTEIFSNYPDAELSRSNAYFEYQVCILLMTDTSKSLSQKLEELIKIRKAFREPLVKKVSVIIQSDDTVYDNRDWGPINGTISTVELRVNDETVVVHNLDEYFGSHKLNLPIGENTFEFIAEIHGAGANRMAILEDNCQGIFNVEASEILAPRVTFERRDHTDLSGRIKECSLTPI